MSSLCNRSPDKSTQRGTFYADPQKTKGQKSPIHRGPLESIPKTRGSWDRKQGELPACQGFLCRGTEKEVDIWAEQSWVGWRETLGRDARLLPGSIYNTVHHVVGSVIIQQQTVQMYSSSSDCVCFAKALAAECSQHEWSQNGLCLRRVFVTNIHCTLRLFS